MLEEERTKSMWTVLGSQNSGGRDFLAGGRNPAYAKSTPDELSHILSLPTMNFYIC